MVFLCYVSMFAGTVSAYISICYGLPNTRNSKPENNLDIFIHALGNVHVRLD